jgi:[ribosomal protein S18]-alanine N-acetyltransferase
MPKTLNKHTIPLLTNLMLHTQHFSIRTYTQPHTTFRHTLKDELPLIEKWAIREKWNPGKEALNYYFNAYPEAFYVLTVNNKPVGSTTIMRYAKDYAFLGLLLVQPEERGKGYCLDIWNFTRELLKDCKVTQFYGVMNRIHLYKQFNIEPIDQNLSYVVNESKLAEIHRQSEKPVTICNLSEPKKNDIPAIANYECSFFCISSPRTKFIKAYHQVNSHNTVLATDTKSGKVLGYGAVQPRITENTYAIRPLYADNYPIAQLLLRQLLKKVPPDPTTKVALDIPASNPHLGKLISDFWLDREKGNKNYDTAVMSNDKTGKVGIVESDKVYSRSSLEFG